MRQKEDLLTQNSSQGRYIHDLSPNLT